MEERDVEARDKTFRKTLYMMHRLIENSEDLSWRYVSDVTWEYCEKYRCQ